MAHGLELRAPLLDHVFFQALLAIPEDQRFTRPAKRLLEPAIAEVRDLGIFEKKKRGFNPPLRPWLDGELAYRFEGLGDRLSKQSGGLVSAPHVARIADRYRSGDGALAEGMLQLLLLDESLAQLDGLRRRGDG
jgi:asparagine synthase (glutamine-hydrolysing)